MPEHPVTQLPPQDPSDYPYIKGDSADVPHDSKASVPPGTGPVNGVWPAPGPGAGHPGGPPPGGGAWGPPPGPGGYPWGAPGPLPYPPPVPAPVPGIGWSDPAYVLERKRTTNRRVAVSGSIVGLVTAIIQMIVTATLFIANEYVGVRDIGLMLLSALIIVFGPVVVGIGCVGSFILGLIACIQSHSRIDRIQPDGWGEAKMPTSALLATSIVLGLPTVVMYAALYWTVQDDDGEWLIRSSAGPVVIICALVQVLLVVGHLVLLRRITSLDPAVAAPESLGERTH